VERRLRALLALPGQGLFGAEQDGRLVGWVHVHRSVGVHVDSFAEVCALVVEEQLRGQGIGRCLMEAAERWAEEAGQTHVQLRSNVTRTRTHTFYLELGYALSATSHRFVKELAPFSD
jgi:GNAT superfamily N-acetyltransferase